MRFTASNPVADLFGPDVRVLPNAFDRTVGTTIDFHGPGGQSCPALVVSIDVDGEWVHTEYQVDDPPDWLVDSVTV